MYSCFKLPDNGILFHGKIDQESAAFLYKTFLEVTSSLEGSLNKTVKLYLSSTGGCLRSALGVYDLFCTYPDLEIVCSGEVCSAATLWLFATKNVFAYPNTFFCFHQIYTEVEGKLADVNELISLSNRYEEIVLKIYATRAPKINKDFLLTEKCISCEEAKELGVISDSYMFVKAD